MHATQPSDPLEDLLAGPSTSTTPSGDLALLGSVCAGCGARAFPARMTCHVCAGGRPAEAPVGSSGVLYSWTRVHVSATRDTPYALGYVDMDGAGDGGVRVLGLLDPVGAEWAVGDVVRVVATEGADDWSFTKDAR
ncbi:OB-fold domain-containing protein [Pseudonocardia nematodicida]|uniref:OB-fold domain-containing protein n=1 Tax=Pseudonocardia nematodicida TaxID=1206997 RepID=A0ABV1KE23_9PSEU